MSLIEEFTRTTRESWLWRGCDQILSEIFGLDPKAVKFRVTCGWPSKSATARKKRRIGECWPPNASKDGVSEIFITPTIDSGVEALSVAVHELIHAVVGCEHGHRAPFSRKAKEVGLEPPWTSTRVGEVLGVRLHEIALVLGPYPHAKLDFDHAPIRKQGTRMLKVVCPDCGYTVRMTRKWLDVGLPTCPCGTEMVEP